MCWSLAGVERVETVAQAATALVAAARALCCLRKVGFCRLAPTP